MLRRDAAFWEGVAWAWRMALIVAHLSFVAFCWIRPNAPLLYPSYSAFDDLMPFVHWATVSLGAALVLLFLPPRVPFGLISTLTSAFLFLLMAGLFGAGGGLIYVSLLCYLFGALAMALFGRALWLYMVRVRWFRLRVMRQAKHG